jgi:hypothetical protein
LAIYPDLGLLVEGAAGSGKAANNAREEMPKRRRQRISEN